MRWIALLFVVVSALAMSQEEQDREWAKAMEESRSITTRRLDGIAPAKTAKRNATPVPSAPTRPSEAAPQRTTDDSGCGVGVALVSAVVVAIAWLAKKERQPTGPCVTGWLCQTPLRFDRPIKTPLGSRVHFVNVTLDIFFRPVSGGFEITSVRLSRISIIGGPSVNIIATNTGEAWSAKAGHIADGDLLAVARAELDADDRMLINAMKARSFG